MSAVEPQGRRPRHLTIGRVGVYAFLITAALFFLLPLWIMVVTSLKPMDEIRLGNILALPAAMTIEAWTKAWSSACTGLECNGISVGFWNAIPAMESGPATSLPATATVPSVGGQRPVTRRINVDLPQPEGPTTAMNSPSATSRLVPRSARVPSTPP